MSATYGTNFQPLPLGTWALAVTDASSNLLVRPETPPTENQKWLLLQNLGSKTVYVEAGKTNSTAAVVPLAAGPVVGSMPIRANDSIIIQQPYGIYIAAICATGDSSTLTISIGRV